MGAPKPGTFDYANTLRHEWRNALACRERSVLDAIHQPGKDGEYIRRISLISILSRVEGWSKETARNALTQSGFALNLRLGNLEKSKQRIDDFEMLIEGSSQQWSSHVSFPEGYPFFGKIDDVLAQSDVSDFMVSDIDEDASEDIGDDILGNSREGISIEEQTNKLLEEIDDEEEESTSNGSIDDLIDDLFED